MSQRVASAARTAPAVPGNARRTGRGCSGSRGAGNRRLAPVGGRGHAHTARCGFQFVYPCCSMHVLIDESRERLVQVPLPPAHQPARRHEGQEDRTCTRRPPWPPPLRSVRSAMLRRQVPNRQAHGLAPCDALCAAGACKSRCSAPTARGRRSSATTSRLPTAKTTQAALARRARAAVRRASSCSEASGARRAASTRARCPSRPGTGCSARTWRWFCQHSCQT